MAINGHGTEEVLWYTDHAVEITRLRRGRVQGHQEILVADGQAVNDAVVTPGPANGFLATWELVIKGSGPYESDRLAALGDARATAGGVFSASTLTPWPNLGPGLFGSDSAWLASNTRGDQVVAWARTSQLLARGQDVYVASRRAGRPFGPPQFLGNSPFGAVSLAIGATGRITALLTLTSSGKLAAAAGAAGHLLSPPQPLDAGVADQPVLGMFPQILVTPRGRAVALWRAVGKSRLGIVESATSRDGLHFTKPRIMSTGGADVDSCGGLSILEPDRADGAIAEWSCSLRRHAEIEEYSRYRP